jgi:serine/threonine protein kinase
VKKGPDIHPDRWPDVSRVFAAAAPLDGPSRNAYLDDACRHDSALRAAVESLLGAHDNAGSFGDAPVFAPLGTVKRLAPGSQLGPFRIETLLGAGGMGEVYRAHDTKLQRAVAIKVLPDFFAQDANRLARFEEEARALAALNHPHIGAIYGLEESAGIVALVLELVEGPTLAERLAVGPLAFDEVVWIARQITEGLEAAHERGIVHRDLKPANIKITPDGNVKILDFGLAKTNGAPARTASADSPAVSRDATREGVIVGTVGYMSPEQARGQAVDKRTDIWAFGCVLFEMCAHQPPFAGATISDAQAAVIEREPDWELLRAETPANLVRLLRRCLTKDPKLRLRDIGEARIALEQDTDTANVAPRSTTRRVAAIAAILAAAASFAIAFALWGSPRSNPSAQPSVFAVPPPEETGFYSHLFGTSFALSPDGSQLAFVAGGRVWVRPVGDPVARPLSGTDGASTMFWSADSLSLAFFAERKLKRINLPDGAVVPICEQADFIHGTWAARDVILLGRQNGASIDVVTAAGGAPVPIVTRNQSKGEALVHWPWFLPDGKRFLYTVRFDDGEGEVRLAKLRPNDREGNARPVELEEGTRTLLSASSNTQWVDPDLLVFVRDGVLMGQRVDVEAARPVAEPFLITERVNYFFATSTAMFSASRTGSVAYRSGRDTAQLMWVDRNGYEVGNIDTPSVYVGGYDARLSPDDSALLVARQRAALGTSDIWRIDFDPTRTQRLTSHRGNEWTPVWIDHGRAILFLGGLLGYSSRNLFRRDLATGLEEQIILPPGDRQVSMDVFPDGRVAYVARTSEGNGIFQLALARGASPTQLLSWQRNRIFHVRTSPVDSAMTFAAGISAARMNVYVSTVPVTTPKLVAEGASSPAIFSRDGRQLFYLSDRTMMARAVSTVPELTVGPPTQLFKLPRPALLQDVSRDGRFLFLVPIGDNQSHPITVWTGAIAATKR